MEKFAPFLLEYKALFHFFKAYIRNELLFTLWSECICAYRYALNSLLFLYLHF